MHSLCILRRPSSARRVRMSVDTVSTQWHFLLYLFFGTGTLHQSHDQCQGKACQEYCHERDRKIEKGSIEQFGHSFIVPQIALSDHACIPPYSDNVSNLARRRQNTFPQTVIITLVIRATMTTLGKQVFERSRVNRGGGRSPPPLFRSYNA